MNPTQYRCRQCKQQWPTDQMGVGLYGRLKYCPDCNSLCDPITEPPKGAQAETPNGDEERVAELVEAHSDWYHLAKPQIGLIQSGECFSAGANWQLSQLQSALTASREECERIAKQLESARAHNEKEWNKWYSNVPGTEGHELRTLRSKLTANTSEIERLRKRLDFLIQHEAYVSHSRDGESCNVWLRWDDEGQEGGPVEGYPQKVYHTPDEAIDAAIAALTPKTDL